MTTMSGSRPARRAPHRWLLACAALLAPGCGPAPHTTSPVAAAPPASASTPPGQVAVAMSDDEPNVVRCGVDDGPRPIGHLDLDLDLGLDLDLEREPRALRPEDRLFLAGRAPTVAEMEAPVRAKRPFRPPSPPVAPGPTVRVERGVPKIGANEVPHVTSGLAGAADPQICEPLVAESDAGPIELEIELASNATPTKVRSSRLGTPSPYARCLMDVACRVEARREVASQRLRLPLQVLVGREAPPIEPPDAVPPQQQPLRTVRVLQRPSREDGATRFAEIALIRATRSCVTGSEPTHQALTVVLTLRVQRLGAVDRSMHDHGLEDAPASPVLEGSRARLVAPPSEAFVITQIANEGDVPAGMRAFMGCVAEQLQGQRVGRVRPTPTGQRTERFRIDLESPATTR